MKPALLVIDVQNIWLDRAPELRKCVEKRSGAINEAIGWFRRRELPIIIVYHEEPEKGLVRGTNPFEFADIISVEKTDTRIVKRYPNSFGKTGLENILKQKGCDTVVLAGLSASWCVLATYFGAMDWDITPYMLRGGVADQSPDNVRFAEEGYDSITLEKLEQSVV